MDDAGWDVHKYKMQSDAASAVVLRMETALPPTFFNTLPRPHELGRGIREKKMAGISEEGLPHVNRDYH